MAITSRPSAPGLEGADDLGRDPQDVPLGELDELAVEQRAAAPGDDDVGLLLLAVTVGERAAEVRRVAEVADAEITRAQVLARKPAFQAG